MRRVQENPKTKMKLLATAQVLMLKKGYAATSVEDICRAAKLTKGSFFHYFKSKEDLGKEALERFCCSSRERMRDCCCQDPSGGDPLKRVLQHLDFAVAMSRDPVAARGCLLGKFAQEMSDTHPEIRCLCAEGFGQWVKLFKTDLDAAKARYAPRSSMDTRSLAEYFVALCEGSQMLAKVKRDRKVVERNMEHFRKYVRSLFKK